MSFFIKSITADSKEQSAEISGYPDKCPVCHHAIQPLFIAARSVDSRTVHIAFWCPRAKCRSIFVGRYQQGRTSCHDLFNCVPRTSAPEAFQETIESVSPSFVAIMKQVNAADDAGLDQLVGIGLRKALEFLIKDYASSLKPEAADQIKGATLAQCINNYVTDPNVKQCAERAAWLGNDETHYVRRWDSKDVSDLRTLVHLSVNWIDNSLLTARYLESMAKS